MSSTLYETDYNQWLKETAQQLRERKFDCVDWDNLIEEIESVGRSNRWVIMSLLTRLLEHLLKLSYWEGEKDRSGNHWASEIVNFRSLIDPRIEDSPSLKLELESLYIKAYPVALKSVSKLFLLPENAYISLEQALDDNWFPDNQE